MSSRGYGYKYTPGKEIEEIKRRRDALKAEKKRLKDEEEKASIVHKAKLGLSTTVNNVRLDRYL